MLVTDDEVINQMILKELLKSSSYQVTLASSGEEAIQYFKKEEFFPFIIVDFNMPKMNGIATVAEIRHLEKEAKSYIIGLIDCDDPNYLKKGLESGMNEVYTKPINKEFIDKICVDITIDDASKLNKNHFGINC